MAIISRRSPSASKVALKEDLAKVLVLVDGNYVVSRSGSVLLFRKSGLGRSIAGVIEAWNNFVSNVGALNSDALLAHQCNKIEETSNAHMESLLIANGWASGQRPHVFLKAGKEMDLHCAYYTQRLEDVVNSNEDNMQGSSFRIQEKCVLCNSEGSSSGNPIIKCTSCGQCSVTYHLQCRARHPLTIGTCEYAQAIESELLEHDEASRDEEESAGEAFSIESFPGRRPTNNKLALQELCNKLAANPLPEEINNAIKIVRDMVRLEKRRGVTERGVDRRRFQDRSIEELRKNIKKEFANYRRELAKNKGAHERGNKTRLNHLRRLLTMYEVLKVKTKERLGREVQIFRGEVASMEDEDLMTIAFLIPDRTLEDLILTMGRAELRRYLTRYVYAVRARDVRAARDALQKVARFFAGGATQIGKTSIKAINACVAHHFGVPHIIVSMYNYNTQDLVTKLTEGNDALLPPRVRVVAIGDIKKKDGEFQDIDLKRNDRGLSIAMTATKGQIDKCISLLNDVEAGLDTDTDPFYILTVDEADAQIRSDRFAMEEDKIVAVDEGMQVLKGLIKGEDQFEGDAIPVAVFEVSATLHPCVVQHMGAMRNRQEIARVAEQVFILGGPGSTAMQDYVDVERWYKPFRHNGQDVFMPHVMPRGLRSGWSHEASLVVEDAMSKPNSLVVMQTNSRVRASGNQFEDAMDVKAAYPSCSVVIVNGRGIKLWLAGDSEPLKGPKAGGYFSIRRGKREAPCELDPIPGTGAKDRLQMAIHLASQSRDEYRRITGEDSTVVVIGYHLIMRGISVRTRTIVPTHIITYLEKRASLCTLVQALGRATGKHGNLLRANGFDHISVLTREEDLASVVEYVRQIRELREYLLGGRVNVNPETHVVSMPGDDPENSVRTIGNKRARIGDYLNFTGRQVRQRREEEAAEAFAPAPARTLAAVNDNAGPRKWKRVPGTNIEKVCRGGDAENGEIRFKYTPPVTRMVPFSNGGYNEVIAEHGVYHNVNGGDQCATEDALSRAYGGLVVLTDIQVRKVPDGQSPNRNLVKELFNVNTAQQADNERWKQMSNSCPLTLTSPPDVFWKHMPDEGVIVGCVFLKNKAARLAPPQNVAWHFFDGKDVLMRFATIE